MPSIHPSYLSFTLPNPKLSTTYKQRNTQDLPNQTKPNQTEPNNNNNNPQISLHPSKIHSPTMEQQLQHDVSSTVDTSRPFSSVKEAVAIFGQRLLLGEIYSPNPSFSSSHTHVTTTTAAAAAAAVPTPIIKTEPSWRLSSPSPLPLPSPSPTPRPMKSDQENNSGLVDVIKKLEAELEQTKVELKLLKERGSETEVALATLNAELHKNMSKLAQAEAAAAGKAAAAAAATTTTKAVRFEISQDIKDDGKADNKNKKEYIMSKNNNNNNNNNRESQKLAHILNLGENDHLFGGKKEPRRKHKHKPIIPLVGDFFFKSKNSSTTNHHNPLYASPF